MAVVKRFALFLVLILAITGCQPRPYVTPTVGGIPLQDVCARYNVSWTWDGVTQVVILEYKGSKAKAMVGSNTILLGKEKIALSAPLRRSNSTIFVPEDFEAKVLAPFGAVPGVPEITTDWSKLRAHTVVIDPGHGGKDPGAQGSNLREKEVVLDIAKRLKPLLEEAGFKVIMTRDTDEFISLQERTEIASKTNADIFLSVHANSNPVKKTEGMETYYVKSANKRDLDEEQRQKNEKIFLRALGAKDSPAMRDIVGDMMYHFKVSESARLARLIVERGTKHSDTPNRGARTCRFFVVRNTLIPAVLVEVGYLTNRREEKRLSSSAYRQKVAEAIAHSVIGYATDS
jgi:N-acetylmuramoyl-L-alanine amidase